MKIILTENQIKQLQLEINRKKTNDKIIEEIKFIKKVLFSYTNTSTQSEKDKLKFVEKYINEINSKLGIHNNLFEVKKNNIYINENTVKSKIKNSFNLIESRINNLGLIKEAGEVVNPIEQVDFGTQTPETVKADTEIANENDQDELWKECGMTPPTPIETTEKLIEKCKTIIIKN
jgi:hypothetical protein